MKLSYFDDIYVASRQVVEYFIEKYTNNSEFEKKYKISRDSERLLEELAGKYDEYKEKYGVSFDEDYPSDRFDRLYDSLCAGENIHNPGCHDLIEEYNYLCLGDSDDFGQMGAWQLTDQNLGLTE